MKIRRKQLRQATQRLFACGGTAGILALALVPAVATAASATPSSFQAWSSAHDFATGQFENGVKLDFGLQSNITLRHGATEGTWTSPVFNPHLPINQLTTSWQADTPSGTWVETELSVQVHNHWSKWYNMGKWDFDNSAVTRTSVSGQDDNDGYIFVDTYVSNDEAPTAYKLREVLHGTASAQPKVNQVAATASDPKTADATASPTTMRRTIDLPVPQYSQEIHQGEYPQYDGGGEAWCSPTSTAMVVSYWHRGPSPSDLQTLPADAVFDAHGRKDAVVDWAAQRTYDADYNGTGNWPFNTAYASTYGLDGSVRQYNSLQGVEQWIKKGTPIVASIAWNNTDNKTENDLPNAAIPSSAGHLLVIRGFTATGDVITNDPASATDQQVRRVYPRTQFERVWQDASAGTVYVIKTPLIQG
jgi:hypothetical protein